MPNILIGTAGWSYKDWEGIVYPANLRRTQHPVEYMAQYFDLIEINTSFYGHIKPEQGKLWAQKAAAANPDFVFTAKLNRAFTHSPIAVVEATSSATIRPTNEDESLAKQGLDSIAGEGRLGALLAQFPVSFKNTEENRDYLGALLHRFSAYPLAVEIRHQSWNVAETLRDFAQKGVAFCNIDQPVMGRSLPPTTHVTSSIGYVRLHGRRYDQWFTAEVPHDRYNYLYTHDELAGWKSRIEQIAENAEKTFVVTNNHFKGKAAANALELKHMLSRRPVRAPETLVRAYPQLEAIVESEPQSKLKL
jgi:uncharacterized protein YecE (DUF72 family)